MALVSTMATILMTSPFTCPCARHGEYSGREQHRHKHQRPEGPPQVLLHHHYDRPIPKIIHSRCESVYSLGTTTLCTSCSFNLSVCPVSSPALPSPEPRVTGAMSSSCLQVQVRKPQGRRGVYFSINLEIPWMGIRETVGNVLELSCIQVL